MSGFEPHPAKAELALRRISVRAVADRLGMSEQHVSRVLNGRVPASAVVRRRLSQLLGMAEGALFHVQEPRSRAAHHPGDSELPSVSADRRADR